MDSFRQATKTDHGYLLLDIHPLTPDSVRVRRSIFKSDEVEIFAPASEPKEGKFNRIYRCVYKETRGTIRVLRMQSQRL